MKIENIDKVRSLLSDLERVDLDIRRIETGDIIIRIAGMGFDFTPLVGNDNNIKINDVVKSIILDHYNSARDLILKELEQL